MLGFLHRYRDILPQLMLVLVGLYFISVYYTRPQLQLSTEPVEVVEPEAGS